MRNGRRAILTLITSTALIMLLTACPANPVVSPSGTPVTVDVVDTFGMPINGMAAAFQTGDEEWRPLQPSATGTYDFEVPAGVDHYGVTIACPTGLQASSSKAMTYQLTVAETSDIRVTCPLTFSGSVFSLNGMFDATAVGADSVDIYTDLDVDDGDPGAAFGSYGPLTQSAGTDRTVVGVAENAGGDPFALAVVRDLWLTDPTNVTVIIDTDHLLELMATPNFEDSVPPGWSAAQQIGFIAEHGPLVYLHAESTAASVLARFVVADTQPGDLYTFLSVASDGLAPNVSIISIELTSSLLDLDFTLPEPWPVAPTATEVALPTFSGLAALPSHPDTDGHMLLLEWDGILETLPNPWVGPDAAWQIFVSSGWLAGDTTYTAPDLTSLPGFLGLEPLSEDDVRWSAATIASTADVQTLVTGRAYPLGFASGNRMPLFPPLQDGIRHHIASFGDVYTVP